jgi:hypothetical protein
MKYFNNIFTQLTVSLLKFYTFAVCKNEVENNQLIIAYKFKQLKISY